MVDLQRLLAVQGRRLDTAYVRRHVVEMMNEDDERVARWDELVADAVGQEGPGQAACAEERRALRQLHTVAHRCAATR